MDDYISRHPEVLIKLNEIKLLKEKYDSLSLYHIPLTGRVNSSFYGGLSNPSFNYSIGTSVSYTIFNRSLRLDENSLSIDITEAENELNRVKADIKFKVYFLIIQYIHAREFYQHLLSYYTSIETYTENVNSRYSIGDLSRSEKQYADSVLIKNKGRLIDAQFNLKEARSEIKYYINLDINEDIKYEDLNITPDIIWSESLDIDIEAIISRYDSTLDDLNSYFPPEITLNGAIKFPFDLSSSWQIGLSFDFPIGSIKVNQNKTEEINKRIDNQKDILSYRKENRELTSDRILRSIDHLKEKIILYNDSLEISEKSLEGVLLESNAGVRTVFDVINAQNSIAETRQLILESNHEIELLQLELFYLKGGFYD